MDKKNQEEVIFVLRLELVDRLGRYDSTTNVIDECLVKSFKAVEAYAKLLGLVMPKGSTAFSKTLSYDSSLHLTFKQVDFRETLASPLTPVEKVTFKTVSEIASALGLADPEVFLRENYGNNGFADKNRRTGRTTAMILEALIVAQTQKVAIYAITKSNAQQIVAKANDYARRLNMEIKPIMAFSLTPDLSRHSYSNARVFIDHTYYDNEQPTQPV